MINRNDIIAEQLLRENIRKAIKIVKEKKNDEENYIRKIIQSLLKEEAGQVRYEYDSLIQLGHLMTQAFGSTNPKKSNSKFPFKESFIDLVSSEKDREMFVEFILDFSNETMHEIDSGTDIKKVRKGEKEEDEEPEIEVPDEESDEDPVTISIGDIPGGDLEAYTPEDEFEDEEEEFTLGEDADGAPEDEFSELKNYSENAYKAIGSYLIKYYTLFTNRTINDEILLDTTENIFLPQNEKREEIFSSGELTERDLFRLFYKINVLSWAGRYNNEYFNDQPVTDASIAPPGDKSLGMSSETGDEELDLGFDL